MLIHFILVFQCLLSTIVMQKVHSFLNTHVHKGHAVALEIFLFLHYFSVEQPCNWSKVIFAQSSVGFSFWNIGMQGSFSCSICKILTWGNNYLILLYKVTLCTDMFMRDTEHVLRTRMIIIIKWKQNWEIHNIWSWVNHVTSNYARTRTVILKLVKAKPPPYMVWN